ncbi:MAG: hypothetical protein HYX38_26745 [Rhodospirillales bacterium]|nr:hypothetical protein [Rhodospirillales bacterium]
MVAMVWGETRALKAQNGSAETQNRLYGVIGAMAVDAKRRGLDRFFRRAGPPAALTDLARDYQQVAETTDAVEAGRWSGDALPKRAVLWEITADKLPRLDSGMPAAARWILQPGANNREQDYESGTGSFKRTFRLYESMEVPQAGDPAFVSAASGNGMTAAANANPYSKWAWILGIAAVVVFILGGTMSIWSGRALHGARELLVSQDPQRQSDLVHQIAQVCLDQYQVAPTNVKRTICTKLLGDNYEMPKPAQGTTDLKWPDAAQSVVTQAAECADKGEPKEICATIWQAALAIRYGDTKFPTKDSRTGSWRAAILSAFGSLSAWLTGASNDGGSISMLVPMLALIAGIAGLTIALGLGTKQRMAGVWIDDRNRVSLSRAQITLWTIVALGGYAAMALFNIGMMGQSSLAAFPTMPTAIAAALGIAASSPMLSALILDTKKDPAQTHSLVFDPAGTPDVANRGVTFLGGSSTGLDVKPDSRLASLADIFMGEENANASTVDLSRLQNVVITLTLVLGYFALLVEQMRDIGAGAVLKATPLPRYFLELPDPGTTFASLLLVSHAAYLAAKAYDNKDPNKDAKPKQDGH